MVVGARTGEHVQIPLIRKPGKWLINKLADCLSGSKIPDLNSGLRVFKKKVVDKLLNNTFYNFDLEISHSFNKIQDMQPNIRKQIFTILPINSMKMYSVL